MQLLMTPWLHSLKHMADIFVVLLFILVMFAIMASNEFKGNLYYRCRMTPQPVNSSWEFDSSILRLCSAFGHGDYKCPNNRYCGSPEMYDLPLSNDQITGTEVTFYGAVGFEDTWKAFLACFQVITFDDWAKLMYRMQDSNGSVLSRILFPSLIFIGSFFVLNLIVAVVVDTFQSFRGHMIEDAGHANEEQGPKIDQISLFVNSAVGLRSPDSNIQEPLQSKQSIRSIKSMIKSPREEEEEEPDEMGPVQQCCYSITKNMMYKPIIAALVLGNLLVLSLNRKGISEAESAIIDNLDLLFFLLFIIEMMVGIGARGLNAYVQNKQNILDLVLNAMGAIEVGLTYSAYADGI